MSRTPSREEEIFAGALAQPAGRRGAFLDTACGADPALRAQVEALLAAHASPANLLEPLIIPPDALRLEEGPEDWIGRYKLIKKIGEGGCGVVWMAEQAEPVRRRVALKVIKAGMDTREVITRFSAERQALAIMDHAGIAKVLDAGATSTGRPFFVMELVRGVRITQYCDEHALTPAARLELFRQVCEAVQHAHQKGIIHRDLKPSNILVADESSAGILPANPADMPGGSRRYSETMPRVKVIDFGIAKATQGRLADGTLVTALEQFIGTPAYMSPEQADTSGLDIDTRSDVYSLGVLLYELLVGGPPFDPKSLSELGRDEIRRMIREVDPPRPSARFGSLAASERENIARLRSTHPARLPLLLTGDLDWIVMKALEKDRARRYGSAAELAADIVRHLGHEPVGARPPSQAYRLHKMIRRNRVSFAAAAMIAATLVAASVVSLRQAWRATRAEHTTAAERARAIDARARADDLLAFMLGDLRAQLAKVGRLDVLESTGDKAMAYFASLEPVELSDTALVQHAKALRQIGEIRVEQRRHADAVKSFEAAHQRAATLAERHPGNGEMLFERGQAEFWIGNEHRNRRELAAARTWLTRYRNTALALARLEPTHPGWRSEVAHGHQALAVLDVDSGDNDSARRGFERELAVLTLLMADLPGDLRLKARVAEAKSWLAAIAERSGDYAEAIARYSEQVTQLETIVQSEPDDVRWRGKLARALSLYAGVLAITGRRAAALECRHRAREIFDALLAADPANREHLLDALTVRLREARVIRTEHGEAGMAPVVEEVLARLEPLRVEAISDRGLAAVLVVATRLQAETAHARNQNVAALAAIKRSIELAETLLSRGRATRGTLGEAAHSRITAGTLAWAAGEQKLAINHWQRALGLLEPHLAGSRDWMILDPAARAYALLEKDAESRSIIERLNGFGYEPLNPWSSGRPASPFVRNRQPP